MKIAICDDQLKDANRLKDLLIQYTKRTNLEATIEVFTSGEELLFSFTPSKYQIVFLDIYMEKDKMSGMDAAEIIRKHDSEISIIFTTISLEHGIESYKVNAINYVVKPIEYEKLVDTLKRCEHQINLYAKSIEVMENRRLIKIRLKDIHYAEAMKHNSILYTELREIKTTTCFTELKKLLEDFPFVFCHRSYIVNFLHVKSMNKKDFILNNNKIIPISKGQQKQVQEKFEEFFWENT
ncbi:LytR/AlgR family response regulator transcription factor [Anaerosphaera multitolerans]|uniref:DNA-binding response regulator n=1 Tax=Anaerosphaera multitolerans TaxID=2487351 RepID=A0A437S4A5_9FIRM|nr:LytTR family DNA-binding domain-containing protein [Anaerosphaera multitolerans]RVU53830.1 DNA-binding response regulator [Anaerosphaera multitolerans]